MNKPQELQSNLFQKIKDVIPPSSSLVNEVADALNITIDSAYRRIRGEKSLDLDEIFILSTKFNFSIDEIFGNETKGDYFLCKIIEAKDIGFEHYLKNLHDSLIQIQSLTNPEILYFAKDIPIFHHFHFDTLAAFKIFFWSKTVMQLPELKEEKFNFDQVDQNTLDMGRKVLSLYSRIPSAEIWNVETINSAVQQIEYYLTAGIIENKEVALKLCDDLDKLIDHIAEQAEEGCKFLQGRDPFYPGNYKLYNNEVILGDNSICVTSDHLKMTFMTVNVVNLMVSTEKIFCDKVEQYLRTMMKKSSLISKDSEKERTRFFNLIHQKVNGTRERIRYI